MMTGRRTLVTPEAIKVMNLLHDMVHKDKVMPLDVALTGPDQVRTLDEAGRVGYYFQGSHWLSRCGRKFRRATQWTSCRCHL